MNRIICSMWGGEEQKCYMICVCVRAWRMRDKGERMTRNEIVKRVE